MKESTEKEIELEKYFKKVGWKNLTKEEQLKVYEHRAKLFKGDY